MKKTILIDGNNLMHKIYGSPDNHNALISSVRNFLGAKYKVIFFFDGNNKIEDKDVFFSGKKEADELIRNYIEKNKNPEHLIVISSDIAIASFAKTFGCEYKSAENFKSELNSSHITKGKNINQNYIYNDSEKPSGISKKDLETFRKLFG